MIVVGEQFDERVLRHAFGLFPSGVTALCGLRTDVPYGLTASSFTSVSLQPPLVSVCISNTSSTWPHLADLGRLGLSVLSDSHHEVARALASTSTDRFEHVDWWATASGAVFIERAALWLECSLEDQVAAGDHQIAILRVVGLGDFPDVAPLVFHRSNFCGVAPPLP